MFDQNITINNVNCSVLKEDMLKIKGKLEKIEEELEGQIKDLVIKEEEWKKADDQVDDYIKNNNTVVKFNVGGKKFSTRVETLLSKKDTLFYKIVLSQQFDLGQEIFLSRSPKLFAIILDYLRYGKVNYSSLSPVDQCDLLVDADYYEITEIVDELKEKMKNIEIIGYETNGAYTYSGNPVGTSDIKDLSDRTCMKGFTCNSPGCLFSSLIMYGNSTKSK